MSWTQDVRVSSGAHWVDATEGLTDRIVKTGPPSVRTYVGIYHCGIRGDGTLTCSGDRWVPPPGRFKQLVRVGPMQSPCALSDTGEVTCFAKMVLDFPDAAYPNAHNVIGPHDMTYSTPLAGQFAEIAAGQFGLCGRTRDNRVRCVYPLLDDSSNNPMPSSVSAT
jgi:hypothetical protein